MSQQNKIEIDEIQKQLIKIQKATEQAKTSLEAMDKEIKDSVGEGKIAWSGASALEFRKKWDEIAEDIPKYIEIMETQILNIQNIEQKSIQLNDNKN